MTSNADNSGTSIKRREFLRHALVAAAAPLLLGGLGIPAGEAIAAVASRAVINVRDKGARGDGRQDDTTAFQEAINALPPGGGTVMVPAGTYMIDAARSIKLRSNMRLQLAADAQLTAIPNARKRYIVVKVWSVSNVEITGGRIVGERSGHLGEGGEWGYGINIQGSHKVTVHDIHVSDCWGDGILVGAIGKGPGAVVSTDVTLERVVSTNNRRQGLTIAPVRGLTVADSTFSNSNGTAPQAGIDIEPQSQGPARDITIVGCNIVGNRGAGLEMHRNVTGVVVKNCTIKGNAGAGVLGLGLNQLTITKNTIAENGLDGIALGKRARNVKVTGNTLSNNSTRQLRQRLRALMNGGEHAEHAGNLRIGKSVVGVEISDNIFSP